MTPTPPMLKKLRTAGILIMIALLVEALSLVWNHPLSFVAFMGISGLLFALGILLYLWALASQSASAEVRAEKSTGQQH